MRQPSLSEVLLKEERPLLEREILKLQQEKDVSGGMLR